MTLFPFICAIALFFSLFLQPSFLQAQTLKSALEHSWHNNVAFAIERRKVQEIFEKARRAAIDLGPQFQLKGSYGLQGSRVLNTPSSESSSGASGTGTGTGTGSSSGFETKESWSTTLSVSQPLLNRGQVYSQYLIGHYDRRISHRLFRKAEAQLILDGLRVYLGVVEASAALHVSEKSLSHLMEQWQATKRNASLGGASKRDVALATASLAQAQAQAIDARAQRSSAARAFRDHFGIDEKELEDPQALMANIPSVPSSLDKARDYLQKNGFDLLVARLELQKQRKISRTTRGLVFLPSISLDAEYRVSGLSDVTTDSFSAKMIFTYPLRPAYFMSGYRSVLNGLRLSRDNLHLIEQNSEREFLDSWENLEARQESEKARLETFEARRVVLRSAQRETRLGTGAIDDLLEAERDFAEAERAAIVARSQSFYARFDLLKSIGRLSPALLNLNVPNYTSNYFIRWGLGVEK